MKKTLLIAICLWPAREVPDGERRVLLLPILRI